MNILLWIVQILLALAFGAHGVMMIAPPPDILVMMEESMPTWLRFFIGVAEVLAVFGLILPGLTRILPRTIVVTAVGLMIIMISATVLHLVRAEYGSAVSTAVLLILSAFVAYMRWRVKPIAPRTAAP